MCKRGGGAEEGKALQRYEPYLTQSRTFPYVCIYLKGSIAVHRKRAALCNQNTARGMRCDFVSSPGTAYSAESHAGS